jgi:tetratricopeptide (TPR) repeat protein
MRLLALLLLSLPALFGQDLLSKGEDLYRQTDYRASLAVVAQIARPGGEAYGLAGRNYFMLGDYKKATDAFQKAFALEPRNSEYAHWLGRSFGRRAETSGPFMAPMHASKARGYFEQAVALDPDNGEALNDLFDYYLEAPGFLGGGYDKAQAIAQRIARTIRRRVTSRRLNWRTGARSLTPRRNSYAAPWSWRRAKWAGS